MRISTCMTCCYVVLLPGTLLLIVRMTLKKKTRKHTEDVRKSRLKQAGAKKRKVDQIEEHSIVSPTKKKKLDVSKNSGKVKKSSATAKAKKLPKTREQRIEEAEEKKLQ